LVIDVPGPLAENPMPVSRYPLSDDLVSQVRVGSHEGTLRAVLDFTHDPGPHTVRQDGATIVAEVGDPDAPARPTAAVPANSPWLAVRDVRVQQAGSGRRLVIAFTRAPDHVHAFVLPDPPRLVIDVTGPQSAATAPARFPLTDDVVTRVRAACNGTA